MFRFGIEMQMAANAKFEVYQLDAEIGPRAV